MSQPFEDLRTRVEQTFTCAGCLTTRRFTGTVGDPLHTAFTRAGWECIGKAKEHAHYCAMCSDIKAGV